MRTKVSFPGLTDLMLSKAGSDTASRLDVIGKLISPKTPMSEDILKALTGIAESANEQPELRARAYRMLSSVLEKNGSAVIEAFASLAGKQQPAPLAAVWEEFTRDTRLSHSVGNFANLAKDRDPARRAYGATVLVNLLTNAVNKDSKSKDAAEKAIDGLWKNSDQAATLLSVIGKTHAAKFGPEVREQLNNKDHVVAEAAEYALTELGLDKSASPAVKLIGEMTYEQAFNLVQKGGDAVKGQEMYLRAGCIACHTILAAPSPSRSSSPAPRSRRASRASGSRRRAPGKSKASSPAKAATASMCATSLARPSPSKRRTSSSAANATSPSCPKACSMPLHRRTSRTSSPGWSRCAR